MPVRRNDLAPNLKLDLFPVDALLYAPAQTSKQTGSRNYLRLLFCVFSNEVRQRQLLAQLGCCVRDGQVRPASQVKAASPAFGCQGGGSRRNGSDELVDGCA